MRPSPDRTSPDVVSLGDLPTTGGSIGDLPTQGTAIDHGPALKSLGDYTIERELGRGTFGVVYKAHHPDEPDKPVALKVLQSPGQADHLLLEPALLAKLDHPCVVRVYDYFLHDNKAKLVMVLEYIGDGDLKTAIDETERFPAAVVRDLLEQIGGALAEAHGKGVVHRDLKPANILIDRGGSRTRYVLADFGVGARDEGIRSAKKLAGTILFMAPEQLRGRPGPQSDLWALGVIAYRMLTGQYPFAGQSIVELARQIQLTTPARPSALTGEPLDPDLERAVLKLLERNETERIGSAADLLHELGHRRDTFDFRTTKTLPAKVGKRLQSYDDTLRRGIRRNTIWMGFWIALYMLAIGFLNSVFVLAGLVVFYDAHRRRHGWRKLLFILGAFLLIGVPWILMEIAPETSESAASSTSIRSKMVKEFLTDTSGYFMRHLPELASVLIALFTMLIGVGSILVPLFACNNYAKANRLRRERVLLTAAGASTEEYLALLRNELEYRYEDVNFHLKYAEALAAKGDDRAAAVEARLLLVQDPYHFTGNLLLAQCYQRLDLVQLCERVCRDYLAVTGYCFEFAELREQCRKAGAA